MLKFKLLVALSALLGLAAISSASGITFLSGKAMMPLNALKDYFGATISYNSRHGIGITLDYHTATIRPGYGQGWGDRRQDQYDCDTTVVNGVTYIPVSFVQDAFGYKYNWNDRDQRMTFSRQQGHRRVVIERDRRNDDRDGRDRDNHDQYDGRDRGDQRDGNRGNDRYDRGDNSSDNNMDGCQMDGNGRDGRH